MRYLFILLILSTALSAQPWQRHIIDNSLCGADGIKFFDINHDGFQDIVTGWEESGETRLYLHPGSSNVKQTWPNVIIGKTAHVEDAVIIPAEQPIILSSCEGNTRALMLQWCSAHDDLHSALNWNQTIIPAAHNKMQWMYAEPIKIGGQQAIIAAGKNENAEIGWWEFQDILNVDTWKWHTLQKVGWVMSIMPFDVDNDGDTDIIYSDRNGSERGCWWLEQTADSSIWPRHSIGNHDEQVMFICTAHLNPDDRIDVLSCAKPKQIFAFKQNKDGTFNTRFTLDYPENTGTAKSVEWGDMNGDGDWDIVLSCEQADSMKSGIMWLEQKRTLFNKRWIPHDISGADGIKFDRIRLHDLDGDGDLDLLSCEERYQNCGLGVIWYENPFK